MQKVLIKDFPEPSYAGKEALNTLYTNISFVGEGIRKIMITSCHAGEGKSFLALNMVRTMAQMGKRAVLVDCDLRKSIMARKHLQLDYVNANGTSHYLAGMAGIEDVLYSTNIHNMFIVPCTKTLTNSLPLVNSNRLEELLDFLAEHMDYVIVDSPPVGLIIDAAKIATRCDGTLLVVGYNSVHQREFLDTVQQIEQSGCPILGTVINQADFKGYVGRKYYYNKYYYNSYYGTDKDPKKK